MRAAMMYGPSDLRVVDLPKPTPAADEALIRVVRFAPYGTDLGVYLNRGGRYVKSYPVGLGADFSGVVEAVGAGVRNVKPGDRVSALALAHCGHCANCKAGRTNLCLDPAMLNAPRQVCAQEYACVTANKLAILPRGASFEDAAMLGGPVVGLNALAMIAPRGGETVAVIGGGAMGWGTVAVAKALGHRVICVGGTGRRGQLARAVGADELFPLQGKG
jgi:threonine dehydrogenase-like Zn-dependent dehydrogenase